MSPAAVVRSPVALPVASQRHTQLTMASRPRLAARRQLCKSPVVVAAAGNGSAAASPSSSPVIGAPQQQHVVRMVNLVEDYFNVLLTDGDTSILHQILDKNISHKDMVRNIGRIGMKAYEEYLADLHKSYPDYYVKSTNYGFVDNRSLFASFEGQVSAKTSKFYGVDLFLFNEDATQIQEVQVYRSNWLGAQGHEERKKLAEAQSRVQAAQAAAQTAARGVMP